MKPGIRRRVLEEWRGVPQPESAGHAAKPVGDIVPGLMKSLGLSDRYDEEEIGRAWAQIVGHPLCLQTLPTKLRHGTLHIHMIQPTIHFVLEAMREEILSQLQGRFGKRRIRNLKFVVR